MHTHPFHRLVLLVLVLLLAAPATSPATPPTPASEAFTASPEGHARVRMAHNFFVFYDPSTTMNVPYKTTGMTRIEAQKYILQKSNASLPPLHWQAGLYPHWKGELWLPGSPMAFKPFYRLQNYDKAAFAAAIDRLSTTPQSPPMLQTGLMKLEHLLGLPGRTEIFLFSDGKHMTAPGLEPQPLAEARLLASKHDICFNIVSSAATAKDRTLLEDIAAVNSCSQVIDFDTAFDHPEHLLGKLYMETQGNGFGNLLFDFDQSAIRPEFHAQLDTLGRLLQDKPQLYVVLSGFCDSIGTEAYNIGLSQRRAERVRRFLLDRFAITADRILLYWYGYANPVASNTTEEGRQLNRRVTIVLRGQE